MNAIESPQSVSAPRAVSTLPVTAWPGSARRRTSHDLKRIGAWCIGVSVTMLLYVLSWLPFL